MSTSTEALGFVPTDGRGSLPFILLRNEPLVSVASWATGKAEVELLDFNVAWVDVAARGLPLLLHDPLCPLTPPHFLRELIEQAEASGTVTVGVHEVTDTVKEIGAAGTVGDTVDRDRLWQVASPVVLPSHVVAALEAWPVLDDLAVFVESLRERHAVTFVTAPPEARRVGSAEDLELLAASTGS